MNITITLTAEELRALKVEAAEDDATADEATADTEPCSMLSVGLCCASVCTSLPIDEALAWVNTQHPTGLSGRWELSEDDKFSSGESNPCECNDHPATHKHYLLEC